MKSRANGTRDERYKIVLYADRKLIKDLPQFFECDFIIENVKKREKHK